MTFYIGEFHRIRPNAEDSQARALEWLADLHTKAEAKKQKKDFDQEFHQNVLEKLLKIGFGEDKIQKRGTQIPDFLNANNPIYNLEFEAHGRGIKERTTFYEQAVNQLFERFYPENCKSPDHMIHVTCTGYVSPSGAQHIVSKRGFGDKTHVTHAYHMGCYASIPSLRMAQGFIHAGAHGKTRIDLVHTELCTLHLNPLLHETEQLVVQSLFADGFIKYSASSNHGIFKVLALHEEILPNSTDSMSWRTEDWGMRMTIAKEVPVYLARALPKFLAKLYEKAGMSQSDITNKTLFAIHPGGPKIIEQVQKVLGLENAQIKYSKEVLRDYGNMSSATLPHVWEKIASDTEVPNKTPVVSLAFGPGLTMSGALFIKGES
jgi:predicted naringenin-chalcone synthase